MGLVSLVAWGLPACSDDDGGGGSSGSSGTGGSAGSTGGSAGSTGGTAGSGGTGGSGGAVTCGGQECMTWKLGGLLNLKACCTATDTCGALSDSTIKGVAGVPEGCYDVDQPGNVECDCPRSPEFDNPLEPGEKVSFPGCCRPDNKCGYKIDLTSAEGPNIGCVDAWDMDGGAASCTPGPEDPCPTDGGVGDASTD